MGRGLSSDNSERSQIGRQRTKHSSVGRCSVKVSGLCFFILCKIVLTYMRVKRGEIIAYQGWQFRIHLQWFVN
jgi:hypothetical protein